MEIDFETWKNFRQDAGTTEESWKDIYESFDGITVFRKYVGLPGNIFRTSISCSSDNEKYFNYEMSHIGEISATNDYDRLVVSVNNGCCVRQENIVSKNGLISFIYSPICNSYEVGIIGSNIIYRYPAESHSLAHAKFEELVKEGE